MGRRVQVEGAACAKAPRSECARQARGPARRVAGGEVREVRVGSCQGVGLELSRRVI